MNNNLKELIHYRIEKAVELMRAAEILFENGSFRASVNRSYYAMFYMVLALLTILLPILGFFGGAIISSPNYNTFIHTLIITHFQT